MERRTLMGATAVLLLVLAACNGSSSTTLSVASDPRAPSTSTTTADDSPESVSTTTASTLPAASITPGKLVVVDGRGDVVTMLSDGSGRQALTEDGDTVEHRQPLWSPAGARLLWADGADSGFSLVITDGPETVSIPMPAMPFFSMWSPDGSRIGALHGAATGGVELELIDVIKESASVVASGAPFYFSWSPDGTEIVSHVGARTLSILGSSGAVPLGETTGDYQTPSWTPNGILHMVDGALVLQDPGGSPRTIAKVSGPVWMVAAPAGGAIAVQVIGPEEPGVLAALQPTSEVPVNSVVVIDPASGVIEVASRRASLGFFWSSDASSLLILVPGSREAEFEWWVWREGEIIKRVTFRPDAPLARDLLPFFDQYAQAWTPWAPDSSAFAFVGTVGGSTGVWVQDLDATEPRLLTAGVWVAWSAG